MVNFMVDELLAERVEVLERGSEASSGKNKRLGIERYKAVNKMDATSAQLLCMQTCCVYFEALKKEPHLVRRGRLH